MTGREESSVEADEDVARLRARTRSQATSASDIARADSSRSRAVLPFPMTHTLAGRPAS